MDPPELKRRLGEVFAKFEDVRLALLFGSRASGRARENSDVDLAVDAPARLLWEIGARVSEAVGLEVDVVRLQDASIPLQRELIRDSIVVHQGSVGACALWRSKTLALLEIDGPWYDRMRDAWIASVAKRGLRSGE